jgi:hypothetical protein
MPSNAKASNNDNKRNADEAGVSFFNEPQRRESGEKSCFGGRIYAGRGYPYLCGLGCPWHSGDNVSP